MQECLKQIINVSSEHFLNFLDRHRLEDSTDSNFQLCKNSQGRRQAIADELVMLDPIHISSVKWSVLRKLFLKNKPK